MGTCKLSCLTESELRSDVPMLPPDRRKLEEVYQLDSDIKASNIGVIRKASLLTDPQQQFQVHSIYTRSASEHIPFITNEIRIMAGLDHPNIIKLHSVFESDGIVHVVTDLERGLSLADKLEACDRLSEEEAAIIVRQLLGALVYLHGKGVCHRNIRTDVVFLKTTASGLVVQLGGFLHAKEFSLGEAMMDAVVGLALFAAPEVLNGYYTAQSDLWSMGILTYLMIYAIPPFGGETNQEVHDNVLVRGYSIPDSKVSRLCIEFIAGLLQKDPNSRMTAQEALNHSWLAAARININ